MGRRTALTTLAAVTAATVGVLALISASCTSRGRPPYDATDAIPRVDVLTGGQGYVDGELMWHREMFIWSKSTGRSMAPPAGDFGYVYELTMPSGEARELRQGGQDASQGVPNPRLLAGAPAHWPAGRYHVRVKAIMPDGQKVAGDYERTFVLRERELRVTLAADADAYAPGETIRLTATLENVTAARVWFPEGHPRRCLLMSGGDWLDLRTLDLPAGLAPGERVALGTWEFVAGRQDERFAMGPRREWFPVPFGRHGVYELTLSLSAQMKLESPPDGVSPEVTAAATAGRVRVEVTAPVEAAE